MTAGISLGMNSPGSPRPPYDPRDDQAGDHSPSDAPRMAAFFLS